MSRFAVLFCIFLFAGGAVAQVQSFGEVSFPVPDGWDDGAEANADYATLSIIQNGQVVRLAVFRPLRSSGNPDNDFRAAWAKVVRSMQPPEPIYEHKSLAGYQGRYGSTNTPDGHHVHLYALEAGASVLPVLAITPIIDSSSAPTGNQPIAGRASTRQPCSRPLPHAAV